MLVQGILANVPGGKWGVLISWQLCFFLLGFLMDPISILMLTGAIFLPIVNSFGIDPLWFAILYAVNTETSYLTLPFGTNLFFMKGVAPKEITMMDIYRSTPPFVALQLIGVVLVLAFPEIALWLPSRM